MKTTIAYIAEQAGVSVTTVDRVLNGRGGVRPRTHDRILKIAAAAGYSLEPLPLPKLVPVTLDFFLPEGQSSFIGALVHHLGTAAKFARLPAQPQIQFFDRSRPAEVATMIHELRGKSQGLGIVALDLPEIREAIRQLAGSGVPVLNLLTELTNAPRIGYVGVDNRAAGRLAGLLLSRFLGGAQGKVAVFAGSMSYRGHEEREMGFRHILSEESSLEIAEIREVPDNVEAMHDDALLLLKRHHDLAGIYAIGGGNRGSLRRCTKPGGPAR